MHTILILSDTIKNNDHQTVRQLKELFPDCNIQILSKTAKESKRENTDTGFGSYGSGPRLEDYSGGF